MQVDPCAYCGGQPTFAQGKFREGMWCKAGRYECLNLGCVGQGRTARASFGAARRWNQRQRMYRRCIENAKATTPTLWVNPESGHD